MTTRFTVTGEDAAPYSLFATIRKYVFSASPAMLPAVRVIS
jgi:hypothetical protein